MSLLDSEELFVLQNCSSSSLRSKQTTSSTSSFLKQSQTILSASFFGLSSSLCSLSIEVALHLLFQLPSFHLFSFFLYILCGSFHSRSLGQTIRCGHLMWILLCCLKSSLVSSKIMRWELQTGFSCFLVQSALLFISHFQTSKVLPKRFVVLQRAVCNKHIHWRDGFESLSSLLSNMLFGTLCSLSEDCSFSSTTKATQRLIVFVKKGVLSPMSI